MEWLLQSLAAQEAYALLPRRASFDTAPVKYRANPTPGGDRLNQRSEQLNLGQSHDAGNGICAAVV